jgi:hypothetical protein
LAGQHGLGGGFHRVGLTGEFGAGAASDHENLNMGRGLMTLDIPFGSRQDAGMKMTLSFTLVSHFHINPAELKCA